MQKVLTINNSTEILAWLAGESAGSVEAHIKNGYPHLLDDYQAGNLTVEEIDVPVDDKFTADKFKVDAQTKKIKRR